MPPTEKEKQLRALYMPLIKGKPSSMVTEEEFNARMDDPAYQQRVRIGTEIDKARSGKHNSKILVSIPDMRIAFVHYKLGNDPKTIDYNTDFHDMLLCPEGVQLLRKRNLQNLHKIQLENMLPKNIDETLAYQREHPMDMTMASEALLVTSAVTRNPEWELDPIVKNPAERMVGFVKTNAVESFVRQDMAKEDVVQTLTENARNIRAAELSQKQNELQQPGV